VRTSVSAGMTRADRDVVSRGQYNDLADDMVRGDAGENAAEDDDGQFLITLCERPSLTTSQAILDQILLGRPVTSTTHRAHRSHAMVWPLTIILKSSGTAPCDRVPLAATSHKLSCANLLQVASLPELSLPQSPKAYLRQSS